MKLNFTKMQGLGNDFVVIDGINQQFSLTKEQIVQLANRHYGVGFDQLLLLEKSDDSQADIIYRIFNADGGEVGQCGNGARCIAKFAVDNHLVNSHFIKAKTLNGLLELQVEANGLVTVNMGKPNFRPDNIPLQAMINAQYWVEDIPTSIVPGGKICFQALSVGNPHAVIWCEHDKQYDMSLVGKFLNQHSLFPQGVNVSFATVLDPFHINLNVYERGAGLTLACGSAACAAVVAGIQAANLQEKVTVTQPGGKLTISWSGENHAVYMSGPANYVFEGEIQL